MNKFDNSTSQLLLNPRIPQSLRQYIQRAVDNINLPEHFWLASSGTESAGFGKTKVVALSKTALLIAAQSVVREFDLNSKDVYLNALPDFHVGGLAVEARAHLAQFRVESLGNFAWDVENYLGILENKNVTVSSLVPTQVFDLVNAKKVAPSQLRCVFVGGGALSEGIFSQARSLGWNLIPTYGMTETCAMLAFEKSPGEGYRRFAHVEEWSSRDDGKLSFLSPALLSGYLFVMETGEFEFFDPKKDGWYVSDDLGRIENDRLKLLGRESELVKIKGETVSVAEVQRSWEAFALQNNLQGPQYVIAREEARDGYELVLVGQFQVSVTELDHFNKTQLPFSRLRKHFTLKSVPLSATGKLLRQQVLATISR